MSDHKLTGTICVNEQEFQFEFATKIHQSGYIDAYSKKQGAIDQIQVYLWPFTTHMLMRALVEPKASPIVYELQGNRIGTMWYGSGNKEGVCSIWHLIKARISVSYFSNGMSIRFEIGTDRGASTYQGSRDETTIGTLAPADYWFMVFVPIDILQEFLRGEPESKFVDQDSRIKKFVESLHTAGLEPHS